MRFLLRALTVALVLSLGVGCRSPSLADRLAAGEAQLAEWPAAVQTAVRSGRIEVGFTPAQVRMAWGEPDHRIEEISAEAETERWLYQKQSPAIGISFGFGSYGRSGGVGGSVGTTVGGHTDIIAVVQFENGRVTTFQHPTQSPTSSSSSSSPSS